MHACMYLWMNGRMDGWPVGGWMDGWMDVYAYAYSI